MAVWTNTNAGIICPNTRRIFSIRSAPKLMLFGLMLPQLNDGQQQQKNQQSKQICAAKASSPGCVISASLGGQWDGFAPNGHLEWNSLVWQTAGPRHHGRGVKSLRYRKPTLWQGLYSGSYNLDANCCNIEMTLCLSKLPQHSILPPVSR